MQAPFDSDLNRMGFTFIDKKYINIFDIWNALKIWEFESKVFHLNEGVRAPHSLYDFILIFDVLLLVLHPRVEHMTEGVLADILHWQDSHSLGVGSKLFHPKRSQISDSIYPIFAFFHEIVKPLNILTQMMQHSLYLEVVFLNKSQYCFSIVLWDILRLTLLIMPHRIDGGVNGGIVGILFNRFNYFFQTLLFLFFKRFIFWGPS